MFQQDPSYFPTLREIRDELIQAQIKLIETESRQVYSKDGTNFAFFKMIYKEKWDFLFSLADIGDLNKPLTREILSDCTHKITKHILYLYSMESFIYSDMNMASRDKDISKIKYYGAFAAALSCIIYFANSNRKNKNN